MKIFICFIVAIICSSLIYYFFVKKGIPEPKYKLRDKEDNQFFDYKDQF